jgi:hypothetical protein
VLLGQLLVLRNGFVVFLLQVPRPGLKKCQIILGRLGVSGRFVNRLDGRGIVAILE